jgi:hypothetical protein
MNSARNFRFSGLAAPSPLAAFCCLRCDSAANYEKLKEDKARDRNKKAALRGGPLMLHKTVVKSAS